MTLMQMSLSGGALILAVAVLRRLTLHRLPKGTFPALWTLAAARLLVPFSLPSPLSVYNLTPVQSGTVEAAVGGGISPPAIPALAPAYTPYPAAASGAAAVPLWSVLWIAGAAVCALYFLVSYVRCCREFRTALPAEGEWAERWLADHRLRRPIALRQWDRIEAPLTYGLFRPVILLPKNTNWTDSRRLAYALEHEFVHIQRFDAASKLLFTAAACVHWFNPLAWLMLALAGRDLELRCDEAVVRRFGLRAGPDYAMALIDMEERKSGLGPFASAFSKNAIEERIRAIMKLKKTSLAALAAAVVLVCCVATAFATSAAEKGPYPQVEEGTFTVEELDRLAGLWFQGCRDMTVADYQEKLWAERDTPEDMELIERYGQAGIVGGVYQDYFQFVYEPLTAERWRTRQFSDMVGTRTEDGRTMFLEYTYTLRILDPSRLTVGAYEQAHAAVAEGVKALLGRDVGEEEFAALSRSLSTGALEVTVEGGAPYGWEDPDRELYAQSSRESAGQWDRLLSPYAAFGLTYTFSDPDLDGNGLTMWFQGREVRGIYDEQEHIWNTEHTGNSTYSEDAVELYAVYQDGKLSNLRIATEEEKAQWDESRQASSDAWRAGLDSQEQREFPQATREDYGALMNLRTLNPDEDRPLDPGVLNLSHRKADCRDLSLEAFNRKLLDWANENADAWNRINCDVIWDDCAVDLEPLEQQFVNLTCRLSGTENGMMVRALHTGGSEQDPGFAANLPERTIEEDGIVTAWCDLYYDISYHIPDKSAITVAERDACAGGMLNAIAVFWQDTDMEDLLDMTEEEVASRFNVWARACGTDKIQFNPITADDLHFEAADERGIS